MKKLKKNVKGVTMVALVVTIIVLLILSAITIMLTVGNNGLFSRAKIAKDEHIKKEATETMNLKITGIQIESYTESQKLPNLQYLADKLCEDREIEYVEKETKKQASLDKVDVTGINSIFTKIKKYPYEFEIDSELKLASIDGIKIADNNNQSEDILSRIEKMELAINTLQDENGKLKEKNDELTSKVNRLEEGKISGIREKLTSSSYTPVEVPTIVGNKDVSIDVKLVNSIEDYKYLEFQIDIKNEDGNTGNNSILIASDNLKYNPTNTVNWYNDTIFYLTLEWAELTSSISCYFKDKNTLHISTSRSTRAEWKAVRITDIYGIK